MEDLDALDQLRLKKNNLLLLGITGGLASGKTTVSNMLWELGGAPIIEFDRIARQVVEPGKPAWKEIVDYFGRQVLQEDDNLDRKKLSNIVFWDQEKRKRLEGFTHPRIYEECVRQVKEIMERIPGAIIQVVIPLLIELTLQSRFDKVLVVYIPKALQIKRLVDREGITQVEAENMLKSQLPIDEKVRYADYVIHNDSSLDDTKKQLQELWMELNMFQKEKGGS
jgi:dephospho-CoA kinase